MVDNPISPENAAASGSSLKVRVASALVLIPFALAAVHVGGWLFLGMMVFLAWLLSAEWSRVMVPGHEKFFTLSIGGAVTAALILTKFGYVVFAIAMLVAAALSVGAAAWAGKEKGRWLAAGVLYIGFGLVSTEWLREALPDPDGRYLIYWVLAVVWATDTAALLVGRQFGGPKLAPDISPKKTWSGAVGGVGAAAIVAGLMTAWLFYTSPIAGLLFGAGASVIAQVGDLFESGIKRRFGIKDFGSIVPGHGGAFDRLDSLLVVMPFAAIGWALLIGAGVW